MILILFIFGFLLLNVDSKIHSKIFNKMFNNNHYNSIQNVYELVNQKTAYGYLSTMNHSNKLKNYPYTSFVGLCVNNEGHLIISMSNISQHTQNINKNNKISLLIPENKLINQNNKRVTITGNINKITDNYEKEYLRNIYLEHHQDAFWLKYIDFNLYKMDEIKDIYYIGGFSKATKINVDKYLNNFIYVNYN